MDIPILSIMTSVRALLFGVCLCTTVLGQDPLTEEMKKLKDVIATLSRQVMSQQLSIEEKARADGGSGLKQVRANKGGPETYYSSSHTGDSVAAIHDHSNYRNTVGQGEGQFVLNGVEFRTRHNDYLLRMPSKTSPAYNVVEDITFPPVPAEVLNKSSVQEQIAEMQEWFKAWKDQDSSTRDYRPYFKPVLCYLEGAWATKTDKAEEPFFSERHSLDADTWLELEDKFRFGSHTGIKDVRENLVYLPSTIAGIKEDGTPEFAQWNYRIMCHPLSDDLPTADLRVVDDLSARLPRGKTLGQYKMTRSARFSVLGPQDKKFTSWTLLDELMSQVPGKDNYVANITDILLLSANLNIHAQNKSALNTGFYHRRYKVAKADAMGQVYSMRSFSDPNVFMAETTQPRISPFRQQECVKRKCTQITKRMSYAVPLEVIYLTPLSDWNPYNLHHFPSHGADVVTERGKRTGGLTSEKAFNGTSDRLFYRTPAEFFSGREVGSSRADTVKGSVGVLDNKGNVRKMTASGIRIFLPNIPGVGILRTRYPIMPVHGENSGVWKELNALKDIVKSLSKNEKYLLQKLPRALEVNKAQVKTAELHPLSTKPSPSVNRTTGSEMKVQETDPTNDEGYLLTLTLSTATELPPGEHSHAIELTKEESDRLKEGQLVAAVTSEDNGHSHKVVINYHSNRYTITSCDDAGVPCWDGHTSCLLLETEGFCPLDQTMSSLNLTSTYLDRTVSQNREQTSTKNMQSHLLLFPALVDSSTLPTIFLPQNNNLVSTNVSWARRSTRLNSGRQQQPNLSDPDKNFSFLTRATCCAMVSTIFSCCFLW